jgi:predicted MFS family arabinose efflux permease
VGVAYAGTGIGMMVLSPLSRFLISAVGWRESYLLLALFFFALAFPAASLLRERREDRLLREREDGRQRGGRGPLVAQGSFPHRERSFWLIAGTHFYDCVCHSVPLVHLVAFAMDRGIPNMEAAGLLSLIGLMGIVGRISVGAIADRIGARQALFLTLIVQTGMIPLLLVSQSLPMYYLLAVLLGLGWGGNGPMYPLLTRDYFGSRHLGATYGLLMVAGSLGMAAGGYGGGYLFDLSGSYQLSLLFSLVAGLISIGLVLALRPAVEEPARKPAPLPLAAPIEA